MSEEQIDLRNTKFTVGIPCYGNLPIFTAISLIDTFRFFDHAGIQLNYAIEIGNSIVDSARNNVVHMFLKESDHQKLIFIDSDIVWNAEDLARLCCWSTKYPIVAAAYPTKVEGNHKFLGDYYRDPDNENQVVQNEYGLVKMTAIGLGFCIIDRSVFEMMSPDTCKYKDSVHGENVTRFFATTTDKDQFVGEDIYFLRRWTKQYGGDLWVDPTINLGHVGTKVYKGNFLDSLIYFNNEQKLLEKT